jgi:hypothetical protein
LRKSFSELTQEQFHSLTGLIKVFDQINHEAKFVPKFTKENNSFLADPLAVYGSRFISDPNEL